MLIICPLLIVRTDTFSPDEAYVCKLLAQSQGQQTVLPLIPLQKLTDYIRAHQTTCTIGRDAGQLDMLDRNVLCIQFDKLI